MLTLFKKHINQNFPFLKDAKLLIAISGGIDSVVLAHLLHQLNYNFSFAHCNFNLRGKESDLDEVFVKELASDLKITCFTTSFNTTKYATENKQSTQMAARELRYNWFDQILNENKFDYILTAHQKNDVLETFLINFTRGTGLEGLTGIPEKNGTTIRPLLAFTRDDIASFAKENNICWREDQSNASTKYSRNKIRHKVIPILTELNPSLLNSFDDTLEHLKGSQDIITESIKKMKAKYTSTAHDTLKIDIKAIQSLSNPKAYLFEILKEYHFTEWNDIVSLLGAQSGKQVFSKSHRLIKDREFLYVSPIKKTEASNATYKIDQNELSFKINELELLFEETRDTNFKNNSKTTICIDKNLLKFPLIVRKWEKGDYFCPAGMQGKKKLSKFFKDEKLSLLEKEKTWLLCNNNNDIIWVINQRLDNRFKITTTTKHLLKITSTP